MKISERKHFMDCNYVDYRQLGENISEVYLMFDDGELYVGTFNTMSQKKPKLEPFNYNFEINL